MIIERLFDSKEAMIAAVKADCLAALSEAIESRGEATFLLSGGSSPEPVYKALSEVDLDWSSVYVGLVDERWVDFDHPKSNEAFISKCFRQNKAANVNIIGMKNSAETAAEGVADCAAAYQQLAQPFDVTILGMGPDGHTASFFPHAHGLEAAIDLNSDKLCAAVIAHKSEVTGDAVERMTMTLSGLVKSRHLMLLITGEEKLKVFREAQAGGDVAAMPVRAVIQQEQVPLIVYWAP